MTNYKTSTKSQTDKTTMPVDEQKTAPLFTESLKSSFDVNEYRFEDWIAFILFWLLALTVFSQFVSRFVFSAPLGWTEEIARYQLIGLGFIGACMGIRKNSHIFVALFHRWMPKGLSITLFQLISVFNVGFIALLTYFAWQIIPLLHIHKMASIDVPISVLYGFVFASLLIMLVRSILFLMKAIKQPSILIEPPIEATENIETTESELSGNQVKNSDNNNS